MTSVFDVFVGVTSVCDECVVVVDDDDDDEFSRH